MVFQNERVKLSITIFTGHAVGATQHLAGIAIDYVNVHHHDLHLQVACRAIVDIEGDKEGESILISRPKCVLYPEIVAELSK